MHTLLAAARAALGLLVDDGAVAVGILLAVAIATGLAASGLLGGDAVGWVLFALVWTALGVSVSRVVARARRDRAGSDLGEPGR